MGWVRWIAIVVVTVVVAVAAGVWLLRAPVLARLVEAYFTSSGVASSVEIDRFDRDGASARVVLGDPAQPAITADNIQVTFDRSGWLPVVTEVDVSGPVVRAQAGANGLSIPSLQHWIDSLTRGPRTHSRFVSDDVVVVLQNARVYLASGAGPVVLEGSARLERSQIVSIHATVRPLALHDSDESAEIDSGRIDAQATQDGLEVKAFLAGSIRALPSGEPMQVHAIRATLEASGIRFVSNGGTSVTAPRTRIHVSADDAAGEGLQLSRPSIDLDVEQARADVGQGQISAGAVVKAVATAHVPGDLAQRLAQRIPLLGTDARALAALTKAADAITLTVKARVEQGNGHLALGLTEPATIAGANGATLRIDRLSLVREQGRTSGGFGATLGGGGLPTFAIDTPKFAWSTGPDERSLVDIPAGVRTHFSAGAFRDADLDASGTARLSGSDFTFTADRCARTRLGAFQTGPRATAKNVSGELCADHNQPLFESTQAGWKLLALARGVALDLPLANAHVTGGSGRLSFSGGAPGGQVQVATMRLSDNAASKRFEPLSGTGTVTLDKGVWRGHLALAAHGSPIGGVTFTHVMATGNGKASIDAPKLAFDPANLQPVFLSPLLASVARAKGTARFAGHVEWTRTTITSGGKLDVDQLDFMTPLGTANKMHSSILFTSLLPPTTAPAQELDIPRIDWTSPLTELNTKFSMAPDAIHVEAVKTNLALGSASLDAFVYKFGSASVIDGKAHLAGVDIAQLIGPSNLGEKVKIDGRISGSIPFLIGPDGLRISNGHIESVGPGRLSIDRTLWTKGAVTAPGVQDFAYQALENLAFDTLTAQIDSVANGRLKIVFHIKGKTDPPKPQEAKVGLFALLRGQAFQQPIALPKGTPIDLTLDTSLNFDELLRAYRSAWSESVNRSAKERGK